MGGVINKRLRKLMERAIIEAQVDEVLGCNRKDLADMFEDGFHVYPPYDYTDVQLIQEYQDNVVRHESELDTLLSEAYAEMEMHKALKGVGAG